MRHMHGRVSDGRDHRDRGRLNPGSYPGSRDTPVKTPVLLSGLSERAQGLELPPHTPLQGLVGE